LGGNPDCVVALKAHIEVLAQQNAELLLRILEQSHSEMNWDEHRSRANGRDRWEDDCQEDNFREHDHRRITVGEEITQEI